MKRNCRQRDLKGGAPVALQPASRFRHCTRHTAPISKLTTCGMEEGSTGILMKVQVWTAGTTGLHTALYTFCGILLHPPPLPQAAPLHPASTHARKPAVCDERHRMQRHVFLCLNNSPDPTHCNSTVQSVCPPCEERRFTKCPCKTFRNQIYVVNQSGIPPGPNVANEGPTSRVVNHRLTQGRGGAGGNRRQSAAIGFRGGREGPDDK